MALPSLLEFVKNNREELGEGSIHPILRAALGALERAERLETHTGSEYFPAYVCVASDAAEAGGLSHLTISAYVAKKDQSLEITEIRDISGGGLKLNQATIDSVLEAEKFLEREGETLDESSVSEILSACSKRVIVPMHAKDTIDALAVAQRTMPSRNSSIPPNVERYLRDPQASSNWPGTLDCVKDAIANLWIREINRASYASFWVDDTVQKWRVRELLLRLLEGQLPR